MPPAACCVATTPGLDDREQRPRPSWARQVVRDPNGTTAADVQALHDAGYDDAQVLAVTMFVALRLAFSTVNDALGARPDRELVERAPAPVVDAVTFGRRADGDLIGAADRRVAGAARTARRCSGPRSGP